MSWLRNRTVMKGARVLCCFTIGYLPHLHCPEASSSHGDHPHPHDSLPVVPKPLPLSSPFTILSIISATSFFCILCLWVTPACSPSSELRSDLSLLHCCSIFENLLLFSPLCELPSSSSASPVSIFAVLFVSAFRVFAAMVACEPRGHPPESLRCPRCDSADTKFCYYNNYNTSQPRHFCKSCKRYWTAGGTLRNVPVGGGLRKNKKSKLFSHVKDMISSSSPDELFHGSLSLATSYGIPQDGFSYDVPRPLAYAPPLLMASPSSSTDVPGDGTLGNPRAYRNFNSVSFGYFGENRLDGDYAMPGKDPPHFIPSDVRHYAQYREFSRALPEDLQQQSNGSFHGLVGVDQAQSHSGNLSEAPSEPSQASSDVVKDPNSSHSGELLQTESHQFEHGQVCGEALKHLRREESVVSAGVNARQQSTYKPNQTWEHGNIPPPVEEVMLLQESQLKEKAATEEEDDELGNVVNVRYPYDWEQVSEVLFGGTPDFFQLSTY